MNFKLIPSLEHAVLVKIVATLWKPNVSLKYEYRETESENEIKKMVSMLPLPEPLKGKILSVVKPMVNQIKFWEFYHLYVKLPDELCWTPQGALDRRRMREALMRDETIDLTKRYKLACHYCLQDDVRRLWKKMPPNRRETFYSEAGPERVGEHALIVFWTYNIMGELNKMENIIQLHSRKLRGYSVQCTPYQYALESAVLSTNETAVEYFWNKLTSRQKKESLKSALDILSPGDYWEYDDDRKLDLLRFLLSQANDEQQLCRCRGEKMLEKYPFEVLLCFLSWPWQGLLREMTNHVWRFLDHTQYSRLLEEVLRKEGDGYKDYDYQNVFEEFWQKSDMTRKKCVIEEHLKGNLVEHLFMSKDMKAVVLMLKNATAEDKERIILSVHSGNACARLAVSDEWDFLKFLITHFISSQENLIKFRGESKKHWAYCKNKEREQKFFQLLDDLSFKDGIKSQSSQYCTMLCAL